VAISSKITGLLERSLEGGMLSGELRSDMNASAVSHALAISAIGLTVTMKSQPDRTFVDNAIKEIVTLLE